MHFSLQHPVRVVAASSVLLLAAAGVVACGHGPHGGAIDSSGPLAVGMSLPALDTPFFSVLIDHTKKAAADAGGSVIQTANATRSSGQQFTDIRNLITAGANVIMAGVVDTVAIKPALDYAAQRHVPVVIVDDKPTKGSAYAVVKADNYAMGVSAAEEMGARLPNGGTVLNITGDLATSNGRDRSAGFTDTLTKKYPKIAGHRAARELERAPRRVGHADGAQRNSRPGRGVPGVRHPLPGSGDRRAQRTRPARPDRPARPRHPGVHRWREVGDGGAARQDHGRRDLPTRTRIRPGVHRLPAAGAPRPAA